MKNKFWLWLCRFAYKMLDAEVKNSEGKLPDGVPGIRDVDHKCPAYAPRKRDYMKDHFKCGGDGHYLCIGCAFFDKEVFNEEKNQ